jgi:uncharacterized protein
MTRSFGSPPPPKSLGKLLLIALLIFVTGGPTAIAQFAPAPQSSWFEQWFTPQQRRPVAQPDYYRRAIPRRRVAQPRPVQVVNPDRPAIPPSYFVAVLGDFLGQVLGQGLTEAFADRPEVAISRKARESSGLVRDDFFDWPKTVHDLLASDEKINMAVIQIGSNDHQPLRVGNVTYEPGSPKWIEVYTARIADISRAFHEKNIPLIWVGLPIVKSDRLSAEFLTFNDFYRQQAEKAGATYIDIWEAFENDHGQYDAFGPDVNGQMVRIRTADGLNFTKAGARKLAHFVEGDIRRNLDAMEPQIDPAVVTVPAETPADAAAVAPNAHPTAPIVKPVAGPILPLTGPVSAAGGQLVTRVKATKAPDPDRAVLDHTLAEGKPLAPKPDRADDFTWPKPETNPSP